MAAQVRGSEYIVGNMAHIHVYEQGGTASLGGVHPRVLGNLSDGTMDLSEARTHHSLSVDIRSGYALNVQSWAETSFSTPLSPFHEIDDTLSCSRAGFSRPPMQIEAAIRPDDDHFPVTRLVCLENTHNKAGGRVISAEYTDSVGLICKKHNLALHVDGARIFNAAVALGVSVDRLVQAADSVSVCLSKGVGAPVGSVLVGSAAFIRKARRLRKALGGGMRQSGVIAAAALIAISDIDARIKQARENPPHPQPVFFLVDLPCRLFSAIETSRSYLPY